MSLIKARVYRSSQREFECRVDGSDQMIRAQALGNLLKGQDTIVVGDYVGLKEASTGHIIETVFPRTNEIFRVIVREAKKKVTAANCDILAIVTSVGQPEYKRGLIDRYLIRAYQWNVEPIVIFNKMDQYDPSIFDIKFERDRMASLGIKSFEISAKFGKYKKSYLKLKERNLKKYLKGKTALFLGQSGVGKSEAISRLSGIELRVNELGKKSGKGSHTTTWSEIIDCKEFSLIDSPGIRSFAMDDLVGEELLPYFPDLVDIAVCCQFNDCKHDENSKGCAFYKELGLKEYDKQLLFSRLESYNKIKEEIDRTPSWDKKV